ncbi:MAG: hypothetical protein ABI120_18345, partial [Gemmatimonadaceae bacterium]
MTWLYVVQFAAPLILIAWLLWVPARNRLGYLVQVYASFAALGFMALRGIWLLPPWWAPVVFAVAMAVAAWVGWRRVRPLTSTVPVSWRAWIVAVVFM